MCAAEVDQYVAQKYLLKRRLGKGAYGIVWKAVDRRTGEVVAIKKIFDAFRDETDAQRTFREILLLQELGDHPNIIRLLDVIRAENDRDIYLVFESMDTDLNTVIQKGKLLEDIHKRYIFYQLLLATKFIHSGNVIHRDQKPSNVLLDANCSVKLCDFGLARSLSQFPEGPEVQALTEYVATRWYRAPEVLLSSSWYTPGVDMWSLGCILGEMLRGRPLFPGSSTFHQLELILKSIPLPSEDDFLAFGSNYSASFLRSLGARPRQTLDALLPPDTPPEALDLLTQLLVFAPNKRLSAAQALQHPYVQRFRCPAREWTLEADVRLPLDEGVRLSAPEYRNRLYQVILERRGYKRDQKPEDLEVAPPQPRAVAQLPSRATAQLPGARPQSSPNHDPLHDVPNGAKNIPRQRSAPLPQPPSPGGLGRWGKPPGAAEDIPSMKPQVRGAGSSLTAQAAAEVTNQALIRRERPPGRGMRAAGSRQARPEARPQPRPGRRMFSLSASQGAQGAARAALGGYSQAYGTVCHSALGRLPLPPGPLAAGLSFVASPSSPQGPHCPVVNPSFLGHKPDEKPSGCLYLGPSAQHLAPSGGLLLGYHHWGGLQNRCGVSFLSFVPTLPPAALLVPEYETPLWS
ncbi:PREDICTED: mitogen-activated protein kinase 15 [Chrysochloris asiatica]|uniref:Mitogen-activated protein kinase 15 n=1 Tax=Chrysochloris asiatica TaxID=185453 RepID=A0A9B0SXA0_CHRAS|nr:PREDICTED: mitogen-activated protein kinase 15 [Chrysochloris asiatica]